MSSPQYEWLLRAFYITYILFERMSLLWKVFPPRVYRTYDNSAVCEKSGYDFFHERLTARTVAICVASWGLVASLQSVTSSFASLLVLRAALGIGEAAFVGVPVFLSFFYKRDELAYRTGLFISAAPLATSFASSLAWLVTKAGTHIPIASWRLLFLLEGFPSIIVSVFVFLYIPNNPGTAKYLTRRERKVALLRLRKEKDVSVEEAEKRGLKWEEVKETVLDPKSYLTAVWVHFPSG